MCLGSWSLLGLIEDSNTKAAIGLGDVIGKEEELLEDWDAIKL